MRDFLTEDARWQACVARDPAADGQFFMVVKTTGVVCRPICPGRPKRENVRFFDRLDTALASGFRACRRCRPA